MADKRIAETAEDMIAQLDAAIAGIQADGAWVGPPSLNELVALRANLNSDRLNEAASAALNKQHKANLKVSLKAGQEGMKKLDLYTDHRFSPDSPLKLNYGIEPKKKPGGPSVPLVQVENLKAKDGETPGSIKLKWGTQKGSNSFQAECFTDSDLTQKIANQACTGSECVFEGLTPKTQYWFRVRVVRGNSKGVWSDPATRVAGL